MNLRKTPRVKLDIRITDVQNQLLPMLVGNELLFHVPAKECFDSLSIPNKAEVLSLLFMTDRIIGNPVSWKLNPDLLTAICKNVVKADLKGVDEPPAVLALVRAFKAREGAFPRECRRTQVAGSFVFMRKLSQKYPPQWIMTMIDVFAHEQKLSQTPVFNLETFAKFLQTKKGNK